jgi:hypothetical protein
MSDHSSHFDSVSGTAINLGMHSVNEKGSLHYPKVSALAREAKELQGKTSQKKDDKVEKATVSEGKLRRYVQQRSNKLLQEMPRFQQPPKMKLPTAQHLNQKVLDM